MLVRGIGGWGWRWGWRWRWRDGKMGDGGWDGRCGFLRLGGGGELAWDAEDFWRGGVGGEGFGFEGGRRGVKI